MRARYLLIILALIPIAFAFPEDLPWRYPARWRLIYEINTVPLTDEYNVWVTITVPEQYYTALVTWMQNHAFCPTSNNWDEKDFWPHPWYVTDYNTEYLHFADNYSVQEFYEYNVTPTCTLHLPKTLVVFIRTLQGGSNFKDYNHYIMLYFPAFHATFWWNGLGRNPRTGEFVPGYGTICSQAAYGMPIELNKEDWLLTFYYVSFGGGPITSKLHLRYYTDDSWAELFVGNINQLEYRWINVIPPLVSRYLILPDQILRSEIYVYENECWNIYDYLVLYPKLIQDLYGT